MNIKEVLKEMKEVISISSLERVVGLPKKTIRLYDDTPIKLEHAKLIKDYLIKLYLLSNNIVLEDKVVSHVKEVSKPLDIIEEHKPILKEELSVGQYINDSFDKVIKVKSIISDNTKVEIIDKQGKQLFGYINKQIVIDNDTNIPIEYTYLVKVFIVQS